MAREGVRFLITLYSTFIYKTLFTTSHRFLKVLTISAILEAPS